MKNHFNIKEVSKLTGLSEYTLRFYEKQNLIKNISRDKNGYRLYSYFDIEWIIFLIKVKNTGMPLKTLQLYAELMTKGDSTIFERKKILLAHREMIENQIDDLKLTLTRIDEKLNRYNSIIKGITL